MIYFLFGEDSYRSRRKLKEIIERYEKTRKTGLSLKLIDCSKKESSPFNDLKSEVRQATMFKEKKLIVITGPFSNAGFEDKFLKEGKDFADSEDVLVLYEEKNIRQNSVLLKLLKKIARCQEFKFLTGEKLRAWVRDEIERYKGKADIKAMDKLIECVGSDLWRMENEIKKLVSFGKNRTLKQEDVDLLVKARVETDIFKTIDAIAERNKPLALNLLRKHIEKGDSPLYLLAMINYQFRNILMIKDLIERRLPFNLIAKKSNLHAFVAKKSYFLAQKFSLEQLKKIYQKIFKVDLDIKTGKAEPEIAIDLLIAEI